MDLAVNVGGAKGVLPGNGDGTFGALIPFTAPDNADLVTADFNGDGKLDLATNSNILLGHGDGTFAPPPASPPARTPPGWRRPTSTATASRTWPSTAACSSTRGMARSAR
jgi:hypothetical protein